MQRGGADPRSVLDDGENTSAACATPVARLTRCLLSAGKGREKVTDARDERCSEFDSAPVMTIQSLVESIGESSIGTLLALGGNH